MPDPQQRLIRNAVRWADLSEEQQQERLRYQANRLRAIREARRFLAGIEVDRSSAPPQSEEDAA